jgi:predicted nucleotidyltransferase
MQFTPGTWFYRSEVRWCTSGRLDWQELSNLPPSSLTALGPSALATGVAALDKLSVVLIGVLALVFLGEPLDLMAWLGVVLTAAGAALVAWVWQRAVAAGEPFLKGLDTVTPGLGSPMQLAELKALAPQIDALLAQYGASNLAVFGSVARDLACAGSDVDLLVDLPQGTSLLDHSALKLELEELLQQKVDLIRRRNLKPSLRQRVEAEAVALG